MLNSGNLYFMCLHRSESKSIKSCLTNYSIWHLQQYCTSILIVSFTLIDFLEFTLFVRYECVKFSMKSMTRAVDMPIITMINTDINFCQLKGLPLICKSPQSCRGSSHFWCSWYKCPRSVISKMICFIKISYGNPLVMGIERLPIWCVQTSSIWNIGKYLVSNGWCN